MIAFENKNKYIERVKKKTSHLQEHMNKYTKRKQMNMWQVVLEINHKRNNRWEGDSHCPYI